MAASIEAHNQKPAATWSSGGGAYNEVSHQISSALEHCVVRLDPKPGEKCSTSRRARAGHRGSRPGAARR